MNNNLLPINFTKDLQGKVLISTPAMVDNRFFRSVILVTEHNDKGTIGVVLNKPSAYHFSHILKDLSKNYDITNLNITSKISIVMGGPVAANNLFIIHNSDYKISHTKNIADNLFMTNNTQVIMDIANNAGPKSSIIALGCATWTEGQLEKELHTSSWLIAEPSSDLIINSPLEMYKNLSKDFNILESNPSFFVKSNKNS